MPSAYRFYIGVILLILGLTGILGTVIFPVSLCHNNGSGLNCTFSLYGTIISLIIALVFALVGYIFIVRSPLKTYNVSKNENLRTKTTKDSDEDFNTLKKIHAKGKITKKEEDEALATLKKRYINGELTEKEYLAIKKDLME